MGLAISYAFFAEADHGKGLSATQIKIDGPIRARYFDGPIRARYFDEPVKISNSSSKLNSQNKNSSFTSFTYFISRKIQCRY